MNTPIWNNSTKSRSRHNKVICRRSPRLGIEALEDRVLMSASPLNFRSGPGNHDILLAIERNQVEIFDNGSLAASQAIDATSAITLSSSNHGHTLFHVLDTPNGIETTINAKGSLDEIVVGRGDTASSGSLLISPTPAAPGNVQNIMGDLTIQGASATGHNKLTVDDSGDTGTRQARLNTGSLVGLAPARIKFSNIKSVVIDGSEGFVNRYSVTGSMSGSTALNLHGLLDTVSILPISGGLTVNGRAGDRATLTGPATGTNSFVASPTDAKLTGTGYSIHLTNVSHVTAISKSASDKANLTTDQTAASVLTASPTDASLTSDHYSIDASGFHNVYVYSPSSRDSADLTGAATGVNTLAANSYDAVLKGTGYRLEASEFSAVTVHSKSARDSATLEGSYTGTNTFSATENMALMTGDHFSDQVFNFSSVTGISHEAGDTAYLYGPSTGTNNMVATPSSTYFSGTGFFNMAKSFGKVFVVSSSASDVAHLNSRGGSLVATPTESRISGDGYLVDASNFASTFEYSTIQTFQYTRDGSILHYAGGKWTPIDTGFQQLDAGKLVNSNYLWDLSGSGVHYYYSDSPNGRATDIAVTLDALHNAGLRSALLTDLVRDGAMSYQGMIDAFSTIEGAGPVSDAAMADLKLIISCAVTLGTPANLQDLATQVINGTQGNDHLQSLDSSGNVVQSNVGNLNVGSSSEQLADLVNLWFRGEDEPFADEAYSEASGSLFGSAGPMFTDVVQGQVGDCWLMASLAEIAARDPNLIKGMFQKVGTNTVNGVTVDVYTARFFVGGQTRYLTVDTELPAGGGWADRPFGDLWAALAEKAYVQANGLGWANSQNVGSDSYHAIEGGYPSYCMEFLTGKGAKQFDVDPNSLATNFQAGKFEVLCTGDPDSSEIVPHHCYAVVGYNAATRKFKLYNPWGADSSGNALSTYDGHSVLGLFEEDGNFISNNFDQQSISGAAADATRVVHHSAPECEFAREWNVIDANVIKNRLLALLEA